MSYIYQSVQSNLSSIYYAVSNAVASGARKVQGAASTLTNTDAKTMALGVAFIGSCSLDVLKTASSAAAGLIFANPACNLANKAIEIFNEQTSPIKFVVVAAIAIFSALASKIAMDQKLILISKEGSHKEILVMNKYNFKVVDALKTIATVGIGFSTGVVAGKYLRG